MLTGIGILFGEVLPREGSTSKSQLVSIFLISKIMFGANFLKAPIYNKYSFPLNLVAQIYHKIFTGEVSISALGF